MAHVPKWITGALLAFALIWGAHATANGDLTLSQRGLQREAAGTIRILVEDLGSQVAALGLTDESLYQRVSQRLERYGLTVNEDHPGDGAYLYVRITAISNAASLEVRFNRTATIQVGSESVTVIGATVWDAGGIGSIRTGAEGLLGNLDATIDRFFDDYLLANPRSTW